VQRKNYAHSRSASKFARNVDYAMVIFYGTLADTQAEPGAFPSALKAFV